MQKTIIGSSVLLFLLVLLRVIGLPLQATLAIGTIAFFLLAVLWLCKIVHDYRTNRAFKLAKITYRLHRFVIVPGSVYSKRDGEQHAISTSKLVHLYNLLPDEYIIHQKGYRYQPGDIMLTPLKDGNYIEHKNELLDKFYQLQNIGV